MTIYPNVMKNVLIDNFTIDKSSYAMNKVMTSKFIENLQKLEAQFSSLSSEETKECLNSLKSSLKG